MKKNEKNEKNGKMQKFDTEEKTEKTEKMRGFSKEEEGKKTKKFSEFLADSSEISNKFMKSLIKKRSFPSFTHQSSQTEVPAEISSENNERMMRILEEDAHKLRFENIRMEKALKTAQNSLALRGQVIKNEKMKKCRFLRFLCFRTKTTLPRAFPCLPSSKIHGI